MCVCVCVCVCVMLQVHRSGGGSGEETVEISGSESARQMAQDLIEEVINSQDSRGACNNCTSFIFTSKI